MSRPPLKVTPIRGEALRYYVESSAAALSTYTVSFLDFYGNGSCTCIDFEIRRLYNMKEALAWLEPRVIGKTDEEIVDLVLNTPTNMKKLFTRDTMCKHIYLADKHYSKMTKIYISVNQKNHQEATYA